MAQLLTLRLFGTPDKTECAKALLENKTQIKHLRKAGHTGEISLHFDGPITENDLIVLLAQSGISGFKLTKTSDRS